MTTYREGTPDDVPRIVAMGMDLLFSAYQGHCRPNAEAMTKIVCHLLNDPDSIIYLAERDRAVVGMIGFWLYLHPMSAEPTGTEVMWWADPAARGCGLRLYRMAERWAMAHGAHVLHMMAPSEESGRLYERLGYTPIERTYQKRIA